jgi:hypothetical protein
MVTAIHEQQKNLYDPSFELLWAVAEKLGLSDDYKARLFAGNAARLYRLDVA